jgi:hypothetical protein
MCQTLGILRSLRSPALAGSSEGGEEIPVGLVSTERSYRYQLKVIPC